MLTIEQVTVENLTAELVYVLMQSRRPDDKCQITVTSIPSYELKGFDSLTALEVLTDFEKRTGLYFDDEIFQDPKSGQMRSVHQIVAVMFSQLVVRGKQDAKKC